MYKMQRESGYQKESRVFCRKTDSVREEFPPDTQHAYHFQLKSGHVDRIRDRCSYAGLRSEGKQPDRLRNYP